MTYVELLIVVTILAVVIGAVLPRLNGTFAAMTFRQARATLMGCLRYAQAYAVSEQCHVQWTLSDHLPATYALQANTGEPAARWEPLARRDRCLRAVPRGLTVTVEELSGAARRPATVTFYPNGQADPAQLLLRADAADATSTIRVDAASGAVSLAQP